MVTLVKEVTRREVRVIWGDSNILFLDLSVCYTSVFNL